MLRRKILLENPTVPMVCNGEFSFADDVLVVCVRQIKTNKHLCFATLPPLTKSSAKKSKTENQKAAQITSPTTTFHISLPLIISIVDQSKSNQLQGPHTHQHVLQVLCLGSLCPLPLVCLCPDSHSCSDARDLQLEPRPRWTHRS